MVSGQAPRHPSFFICMKLPLRNKKSQEEYQKFLIEFDGEGCKFCNLARLREMNTVVDDLFEFIVIENCKPYDKAVRHLVLIPKGHYKNWHEMEWGAKMMMFKMLEEYSTSKSVVLLNGSDSGRASVKHAHWHIIDYE